MPITITTITLQRAVRKNGRVRWMKRRRDKIDVHPEAVAIESKQITLSTNGKQRTLRLSIRF